MLKILMAGLLTIPLMVNSQTKFDLNKSMEFIEVNPCSGTSLECNPYVLGQGKITKETPKKLENLIKDGGVSKIAFDSQGGDFESALDLGVILAENGIEVVLQNSPYEHEIRTQDNNLDATVIELSDLPQCKKECGYAFLGGVLRNVEDGSDFSIEPLSKYKGNKKSQYSEAEILEILDGFKVSKDLLVKLSKEKKELKFSNTEITSLSIENYSKKEFNWVYQKSGNITAALKAIQLSEGRGRLVIVVKKDISKKENDQHSLEVLFKPLFEEREFISSLGDLYLSLNEVDSYLWKSSRFKNTK